MNNSALNSTDVAAIASQLRHVASEDAAQELLNPLSAKQLRLVMQAYDPHFPQLRAKAGRNELVRYMIRHTVGIRAWLAQWRAEHH